MTKLKEGDAVAVATREQTSDDIKSGLYYGHYAGLTGTILKIYADEVSVVVNMESLPEEIRLRHEEGERAMRQKWLDNLSEEARGRIEPSVKQFGLNYTILTAMNDLSARKAGSPTTTPDDNAAAGRPSRADKRAAREVAQSAHAIDPLTGESDVGEARGGRRSARDLDAAEEAFISERRRGS